MNTKIRKYFVVLLTFLFIGCAINGPVYQKVNKIPENSGVVYIYRPSHFRPGEGLAPNLYRSKGTKYLTKIYNGGYFPYFVEPGEIDFSVATETESSVTLNIAPGKIYYIKLTMGMGVWVLRPHLIVVDPETAEKEIAECKLIPKQD